MAPSKKRKSKATLKKVAKQASSPSLATPSSADSESADFIAAVSSMIGTEDPEGADPGSPMDFSSMFAPLGLEMDESGLPILSSRLPILSSRLPFLSLVGNSGPENNSGLPLSSMVRDTGSKKGESSSSSSSMASAALAVPSSRRQAPAGGRASTGRNKLGPELFLFPTNTTGPRKILRIQPQQATQQEQHTMADTPIDMADPFKLVRERIKRMKEQGAEDGEASPQLVADFNRNIALFNVMRNLDMSKSPKPAAGAAGSSSSSSSAAATAATANQNAPILVIDNLAISKLLTAQMKFPADEAMFSDKRRRVYYNVLAERGCHFCLFECDWGVNDARIQLPANAATGTCEHDDVSNSQFFQLWLELNPEAVVEKETQFAELNELDSGSRDEGEVVVKAKTFSKIDGEETTQFQGLLFCRDCPWSQIDPTQARICKECRHEKLAIIAHGQHLSFLPIEILDAADYTPAQVSFRESFRSISIFEGDEDATWVTRQEGKKRCMICPSRATVICADCPLKVCELCQVLLGSECKGWLDKLIFHFGSGRVHVRNDAFLLRSDGGGF